MILPNSWGETILVFIPKEGPLRINDFHPIALCNVIYKPLSTVLTNHIKPLLGSRINQEQFAFIPRRCIHDNITIAQELTHSMYNSHSKKPLVMMKIDLQKAFDSLSWSPLARTVGMMNFPQRIIDWVMACVTCPKFKCNIKNFSSRWLKSHRSFGREIQCPPTFLLLSNNFSLPFWT